MKKGAIIGIGLAIVVIIIIVALLLTGSSIIATTAASSETGAAGASNTPPPNYGPPPSNSAPLPPAAIEAGIKEGSIIRCTKTGGIYKIVNGKKQWYPSPDIYTKYGSPAFTNYDCGIVASIADGPSFERFTSPKLGDLLPSRVKNVGAAPEAKLPVPANIAVLYNKERMSISDVYGKERMSISDVYGK